MTRFEPVLEIGAELGESPVWSAERQMLFFVDILGRTLHRYDPVTGAHRADAVDEHIGCVQPAEGGGFVAGMRSGIWLLDDDGRKRECLAENPEDQRTSRFNDGCVDPRGRLLVGTVDETRANGAATLYRCDARGLVPLVGGLLTSNGLAFSPDGCTLYHSDTPRFTVWRHDYDPETGEIANRRVFARLDPDAPDRGRPDGAAVDAEGCYWTALYAGGRVQRYDPDGRLMAEYPASVRGTTMPAFGGPDMKTLFLTTVGGESGGALHAMPVDVAGLPATPFKRTAA
ncbi:SMP-30/gluconolactonase/LRE family protein [Sphingosinicella microcystinivorans]|uniref:SMP-30/gluconolactonase/LRE family protein n=1 Tax=Sphingosinicella microcystinivorans TaxID=335406 RepID=UPI0022F3E9A3|nr:SMP-30/gluconolactonase/LRE family protein [Sphingosinicella microcystinivorans]WBX84513.1 SMP-30/gluconolactonase/LRE family protein [Sphingosinicella microcystinivorans]